jgi:quercetin dioxygenase-like cupin family protein
MEFVMGWMVRRNTPMNKSMSVYILEGAFPLELEGREPITVKTGQAVVEPPNVRMTGYNRSSTEPLRVVIFYVSDPDTPFLDPIH